MRLYFRSFFRVVVVKVVQKVFGFSVDVWFGFRGTMEEGIFRYIRIFRFIFFFLESGFFRGLVFLGIVGFCVLYVRAQYLSFDCFFFWREGDSRLYQDKFRFFREERIQIKVGFFGVRVSSSIQAWLQECRVVVWGGRCFLFFQCDLSFTYGSWWKELRCGRFVDMCFMGLRVG